MRLDWPARFVRSDSVWLMNVTGPWAAKVRLKVHLPLLSVVAVPTGELERTPFLTVNRRTVTPAWPGTMPPWNEPTLPVAVPKSDSAGRTEMTAERLEPDAVLANRRVLVRGPTEKVAVPLLPIV